MTISKLLIIYFHQTWRNDASFDINEIDCDALSETLILDVGGG